MLQRAQRNAEGLSAMAAIEVALQQGLQVAGLDPGMTVCAPTGVPDICLLPLTTLALTGPRAWLDVGALRLPVRCLPDNRLEATAAVVPEWVYQASEDAGGAAQLTPLPSPLPAAAVATVSIDSADGEDGSKLVAALGRWTVEQQRSLLLQMCGCALAPGGSIHLSWMRVPVKLSVHTVHTQSNHPVEAACVTRETVLQLRDAEPALSSPQAVQLVPSPPPVGLESQHGALCSFVVHGAAGQLSAGDRRAGLLLSGPAGAGKSHLLNSVFSSVSLSCVCSS